MPDDRRFNRRSFFRSGFRELLKPVVDSLDEKLAELGKIAASAQPAPAAAPPKRPTFALSVLRPPGALPEAEFLQTCSRCGACVNACPANAIVINERTADGAPFVDANAAACVVCATLDCMNVCPTGALVPVPMADIDMGTAIWNPATCLRTAGAEPCTTCVDVCPIGEVAIRLDGNNVQVIEDGCVGCGLCQNKCPTTPKSITVQPAAMRT